MKRVLAIFVQGLMTVLPLVVTGTLLWWLGAAAERFFRRAVQWALPDGWYVPGMGIVAALCLVFGIGLLVRVWGVPRLIRRGERIVHRIPLVKTIYGAVFDLLSFFRKDQGTDAVSKVVMVSLGGSSRAVGLLTREDFEGLPAGLGGPSDVVVYVPFSYQLGGYTLIIPRERIQPLDMSLEDAMRFIVTAGAKGRSDAGLAEDHGDGATAEPGAPTPIRPQSRASGGTGVPPVCLLPPNQRS